MRKLIIIVIVSMLLVTTLRGVYQIKENNDLWEEIVNREYTGSSMQQAIYFFEENGIKYVRYMRRGGGIYCLGYDDIVVNINNVRHISFDLPGYVWNPTGNDVTVSLAYIEDGLFEWIDEEYYFEELFRETLFGSSEGAETRVG